MGLFCGLRSWADFSTLMLLLVVQVALPRGHTTLSFIAISDTEKSFSAPVRIRRITIEGESPLFNHCLCCKHACVDTLALYHHGAAFLSIRRESTTYSVQFCSFLFSAHAIYTACHCGQRCRLPACSGGDVFFCLLGKSQ